jgi:molybdopterin/thiamine biosynthesis adenylyltransferase/molybdopterin converting factor small subunit
MPTVIVPSPLRRQTEGQSRVQVEGSTVGAAIDHLDQQYPGVKSHLCDEGGQIKPYINVFVNGDEIRALQGIGTALTEKDEVSIVPAMAGGGNHHTQVTYEDATDTLTDYDRTRYDRQMMIEGWGAEGQSKLKASSVFVAGAGGLGSPVSIYLAIAGVGELRLCDADRPELSNLNRQILHTDKRIGELKAVSAEKTLRELNPTIKIVTYSDYLDENSVERIVGKPDIIVDCLDNFETRYLLNSYCVENNIPFVHGAIWGMMGQVTFLHPPETPCLRCLVPKPPPKELFPVVGVTPGIIGCIQAMEVLKYLVGVGTPLKGRLLVFDGEEMTFNSANVIRTPSCQECGSTNGK